jgi:hypothetical protein
MTVIYDIQAALDTKLATLSPSTPTAWENKTYTPTKGTLWIRPTNLPGDTEQAGLGDSGEDMTIGVYQVDVFAPAGKGRKVAQQKADAIANLFKRGTDLTYNSRTVRINSVSSGAARNDDGWYHLPVIISYYSFTQPRS